MKYIAFWEMKPEDIPKVTEKFNKRMAPGGEKLFGPGHKTVFGPYHIGGEPKGFTILETDNPEVLTNFSCYYLPELTMKIYPIVDSNQVVESYLKYHK